MQETVHRRQARTFPPLRSLADTTEHIGYAPETLPCRRRYLMLTLSKFRAFSESMVSPPQLFRLASHQTYSENEKEGPVLWCFARSIGQGRSSYTRPTR